MDGDIAVASVIDQGGNALFAPAGLLPLADNGGPTLTHALSADSPALDGGDPGIVGAPPTDQRGLARIQGERIDIGAFEAQPGEPQPTPTTDPGTPTTTTPGGPSAAGPADPVAASPTFVG